MTCNVGKFDRMIRLTAGIVILLLGLYLKSWWGLIGFIPLITGAIRFCPLYVPLGISTCKEQE